VPSRLGEIQEINNRTNKTQEGEETVNTYVFHVDGNTEYDTLKINALDETHATNILLSLWLNAKPLTTEGRYRLIHVEKGSK
jgi:hypothetical protein